MKSHAPKISIGVIVILLLTGAAVILVNKQKATAPNSIQVTPKASSSNALTPEASAQIYSSTESAQIYRPQSTPSTSKSPSATPTPQLAANMQDYVYPSSTVVNQTSSTLQMQSGDDALKITNWYKDKIRASGFNAKSFTQTNTNGTILNKLSAAKPGEEIDITIKKDQSASNVSITVDRS